MAYIGRDTDKISNVEVLDNITFDGSSSYTLQKGGSNFTPSSANTLLVSIDGVVQAGNFTVSGSTIDFGTAVAGTSTCDFILHYGVGLITTPSDGTVSLDKLSASGTKDATTFLRGDNTFATLSTDLVSDTTPQLGGTLDANGNNIDVDGNELILDADADTSIKVDTDDRVDFKIGNTKEFVIDNSGQVVFGSGHTNDPEQSSRHGQINLQLQSLSGQADQNYTKNNNNVEGTIKFYKTNYSSNFYGQALDIVSGAYSESSHWGGSFIRFYTTPQTSGTPVERMKLDRSGNLSITGSLSKGSGSFKIDHPLSEKTNTHHLVHSFVEAPQANNIYRGKIDLINGTATVNIDTIAGMTEGTFVSLNREIQCFTSNETGWTAVKGSVSGNTLTITAQDNTCTDSISWLVIGERKDQHMYDTEWTDENGKVIVEPLKNPENDFPPYEGENN